MRALGILLVGACLSISGCRFNVRQVNLTDPPAANPTAVQRVLVACYQEHGVDARALEGGAVHFDRSGALSKEDLCSCRWVLSEG